MADAFLETEFRLFGPRISIVMDGGKPRLLGGNVLSKGKGTQ